MILSKISQSVKIFYTGRLDANSEAGSGLLELVVGSSLAIVLTSLAASQFISLTSLQNLVSDRSRIYHFEERIRQSLQNDQALRNTANQNPFIRECIQADERPCRLTAQQFALLDASGDRIDGLYYADGSRCNLPSCPVEIKLTAIPTCPDLSSCDQMRTLIVEYSIVVDGVALRTGSAVRVFKETAQSDINRLCSSTSSGTSQLAYRILPNRIDCSSPPPFNRVVTGIRAGDCVVGKQVLVGFDAVSGTPICQDIKFDRRKNSGGNP